MSSNNAWPGFALLGCCHQLFKETFNAFHCQEHGPARAPARLLPLPGCRHGRGMGTWGRDAATGGLPAPCRRVGAKWLEDNPYSKGAAQTEAVRIGSSGYNQNCARCHGLEAMSGGIAPDLRNLDEECASLADAAKKNACMKEVNDYFIGTVRRGRTRDGRVYMPPFEGMLSQEALVGHRNLS